MQLDQLQQGLQHAFFTDRHRIVFWYDAPGHFADSLNELALEGVQVINMAGESTLGVKSEDDLPPNAKAYLQRIEEITGAPIDIISTGPDRVETIIKRHPFA